jgi:hypothetical protein
VLLVAAQSDAYKDIGAALLTHDVSGAAQFFAGDARQQVLRHVCDTKSFWRKSQPRPFPLHAARPCTRTARPLAISNDKVVADLVTDGSALSAFGLPPP